MLKIVLLCYSLLLQTFPVYAYNVPLCSQSLNKLVMLHIFIHGDSGALWKPVWMYLHKGTLDNYSCTLLSVLMKVTCSFIVECYLITDLNFNSTNVEHY